MRTRPGDTRSALAAWNVRCERCMGRPAGEHLLHALQHLHAVADAEQHAATVRHLKEGIWALPTAEVARLWRAIQTASVVRQAERAAQEAVGVRPAATWRRAA